MERRSPGLDAHAVVTGYVGGVKSSYRTASRDLGERVARYSSPRPVQAILVFGLIFGLPGVALLTGFQSAKGQVFDGERTTNTLLGCVLVAVTFFFIGALLRKATLTIDEHANGLRWIERGIPRNVLWDDIREIHGSHVRRTTMGIEVARTNVHRLTLENGGRLVMTNMLRNSRRLMERVEREVGERVSARTRATLDTGGIASFGPVQLTSREVRLGDGAASIPWCHLRSIDVTDGILRLRGEPGAKLEIEWAKVANGNTLLTLIEERGGVCRKDDDGEQGSSA